jgi:hypothetical protein
VSESTFIFDAVGTARVSGNFSAAGNISFPTFSTTGIGVNASGAFYFNLAGAGTGDQNLAIGSNARALGSYGIAINNAQAQAGGIAISYTRADSGDFAAASAITFNGLVPISNVYFGTGKYRQNPDGSFTTGAGADYAINGSGASGTNLAGGNITIAGGKGTGSGASGDVVISTATTTTSGTTLQTLTPRLEVFGNTGNVLIQSGGTFTDAGFRLDVNGTARVSGSLTTISANPINVTESNSSTGESIVLCQTFGQARFIGLRARNSSFGGDLANRVFIQAPWGTYMTTNLAGQPSFSDVSQTWHQSKSVTFNAATEYASAQVAIDSTTKGFLPPRMTTTQKNAIGTPAAGLQVYDTTLNQMSYYNGTSWVNF